MQQMRHPGRNSHIFPLACHLTNAFHRTYDRRRYMHTTRAPSFPLSAFRFPLFPGATLLLHNTTLLLHNATFCYTPATPNRWPISAVTTASTSTSDFRPHLTMLHSRSDPATPVLHNATQCNIDATKCNTLQHRCNILKRCQNRHKPSIHQHFRFVAIP